MEKENQMVFNFYGGNQQINPNATQAVQNYYGDQFAKEKMREEALAALNLSSEAKALAVHVAGTESLAHYVAMLSECTTANDVAQVAIAMFEQEPRVTKELIVKGEFITKLRNLCPKLQGGDSINNLRQSINNALAKRPQKRT